MNNSAFEAYFSDMEMSTGARSRDDLAMPCATVDSSDDVGYRDSGARSIHGTARLRPFAISCTVVIGACGKGWMAEIASRSLRGFISEGTSPM